ncbi:DnaA regulatory inactivator Hda [Halioglobus japonicus]|uniref:DnaA regulatory inactivator Hda n=1 Tax=Halioglobus japonicus TaxID=930805 RepID=A0AAP8MGM4_9GAMM|nr:MULTISPECIES: DnaA regulatory inactivator Hda [Halioglobus]AQA19875.1 DnaA regulatory inactivator Hda [Halioglobus japonicus]KZX59601.1 hypothetical protein A3709_15065 [Halioglobus sp. HI00S01]PLW87049.1 DnaA regulatory inactivator Hda [Halioglobus japonicus]GHD10485.1 DnaA regulatory inactivator Hda [Halioglobus japonicus]
MASEAQLALPVFLRDDATFENYLAGDGGAVLLGSLRQQVAAEGEPVIYLHGGSGSGKSHLLQAACHLAGGGALYLPLAELAGYAPQDVLAGAEHMALLCLDDLDAVVGNDAWEMALFNLYNTARETGCRLLLAAAASPRALEVDLADLRSRLAWGVVHHLPASDDERKCLILEFRAALRGLQLPPEVAAYLVKRAPRSLDGLLDCLDKLDRASLAYQRALSIPFVKQTLGF